MKNPSSARLARKKLRASSVNRGLILSILGVTITLYTGFLVHMTKAVESSQWSQTPVMVQKPQLRSETQPEAVSALVDPCSLKVVSCGKVITATVTNYQAVEGQTDSSPCSGAMPKIDFCNPPFPIVAHNNLPLGSKVLIQGKEYVVADRMNKRYGATYFDILTDSVQPTLRNEPVTIL